MKHFDKPLPRVLTYLPGGGGGGGGGRTLIFSHICRFRHFFLGGEGVSKSFDFNILVDFRKIFYLGVYVFINESTPPPPPHTNTGHTCMYV